MQIKQHILLLASVIILFLVFLAQRTSYSQPSLEASIFKETHLIFDCKSWSRTSYKVVDYKIKQEVENDHSEDRHDILSKHYFTHFSGFGSTLEITQNFRQGLAKIVDYLKMTLNKERISILDSTCGDLAWMPTFLRTRDDIDYTGYDLLHENVDRARMQYSNESWKFEEFDLVKQRIRTKFDLIINRYTAIHLGLRDDIQMFHNFQQSGSLYLLTTTYPQLDMNTPMHITESHRYHKINLAIPPFRFSTPICHSMDATEESYFVLWDMKALDEFNARNQDLFMDFSS